MWYNEDMKRDIGCADFREATRNREMVAKKRNVIGYVEVETALAGTPSKTPLPDWIPRGKLPSITKEDLRRATRAMHEETEGD